jgi:YidC/Oxa1 family membrane protein insertase
VFDSITGPAAQLLAALATALGPIGGPAAAIVVLTLAVRAALHPLTRRAVRGERARLALTPRLAELRRRHTGDPTKLAEATMSLYRTAGVSPLAGFLPVLAQAPVFIVLFQVFAGQSGVLGEHLVGGGHPLAFAALLAGLTVVAWLTSRRSAMLMRVNATEAAPTGLLARLPRVLPYATVLSALVLPMALVVYLLTSSAWTLVENTVLRRGLIS